MVERELNLKMSVPDKYTKECKKYLQPAIILIGKRKYSEALELIEKYLKVGKATPSVLFAKAFCLYQISEEELPLRMDEINKEIDKMTNRKEELESSLDSEGRRELLELDRKSPKIIREAIKVAEETLDKKKEALIIFKKISSFSNSKEFISVLEDNLIPGEINNLERLNKSAKFSLDAIENEKKLLTHLESEGFKYNIPCPYCGKENLIGIKKSNGEYFCANCEKNFIAIVGTVRAVRGLGGYMAHTVTIRLKNIEGGESQISYFSSYTGYDFRSGDQIAIVYKKGIFGGYSGKPALIINYNLGEHYVKL